MDASLLCFCLYILLLPFLAFNTWHKEVPGKDCSVTGTESREPAGLAGPSSERYVLDSRGALVEGKLWFVEKGLFLAIPLFFLFGCEDRRSLSCCLEMMSYGHS
ncbi:hypothetical protein ACH5RR_024795 [Cinchona calisaya]|uniref:Uncharacterized protein n=1 Tax=Cinchona calisaya TaxID=153742 RepID=A0ABD2YYV7_9GENT